MYTAEGCVGMHIYHTIGQGRSKLFEGGVAKVVKYLGGSEGILPQENFVKLDVRRSLLRPF